MPSSTYLSISIHLFYPFIRNVQYRYPFDILSLLSFTRWVLGTAARGGGRGERTVHTVRIVEDVVDEWILS